MKYIKRESDFHREVIKFKKYFKGDTFPGNVFTKDFKYYLGFQFEMIFIPEFFEGIQNYMRSKGMKEWTFFSLDPSPNWFLAGRGDYGLGIISTADKYDSYREFLYPEYGKLNVSVETVVNNVAVFSESMDWGIYGSRQWDISIVGLKSEEDKDLLFESFGENSDIFYSSVSEYVEELDEMFHFSAETKEEYSQLVSNYSK